MIRLTRPYFDEAETAALARVLSSGMLVQSEEVKGFESSVARFLETAAPGRGAIHALAVSNGTAALELALMACGTRAGDEVVVPAVTWPSPGNAVILRGATPILVDVDPETFNLDPKRLAEVLTPHTRAVIAVDQFGVPAEIPAIRAICGDLELIEDAACSLGSSLGGTPCGLLGDIGTMSFHPRKVITTGEGGMVLTRDPRRASSVQALRNHGQDSPGVFRDAGPNARMTELQGALGAVQMNKLATILRKRREMAEEIRASINLSWQRAPVGAVVNYQTLGFVLPTPPRGTLTEARQSLITSLRTHGIEAGQLSHALHRLPQFARSAANAARSFPVADAIVDGGVAVPLHPGMTAADVNLVIDALRAEAEWAVGRESLPS